ncbi:hypothetical protein AAMO2058_001467200 [Amorphochlora amoebiformis]
MRYTPPRSDRPPLPSSQERKSIIGEPIERLYERKLRVPKDANCLFCAISHQVYGNIAHHRIIREKCADYIDVESNAFQHVVDGTLADYTQRLRERETWGDNCELQALCELYQRPIQIYAPPSLSPIYTYSYIPDDNPSVTPIRLSYHCRNIYNSIEFLELSSNFLSSVPGTIEDKVIASARRRRQSRQDDQLGGGGGEGGGVGGGLPHGLENSRKMMKKGLISRFDSRILSEIKEAYQYRPLSPTLSSSDSKVPGGDEKIPS